MAARLEARGLAMALTAALIGLLGCNEAPEPAPEPSPIGALLAAAHSGWCSLDCRSYELYSDGEGLVELRAYAYEPELHLAGTALADLKPASADALEQALAEAKAAVAAGPLEDSPEGQCGFTDSPRVEVWLEAGDGAGDGDQDNSIRWDRGCPPAGFEALDELVVHIMDNLAECTTTQHISPRIGCEILNPWAESY